MLIQYSTRFNKSLSVLCRRRHKRYCDMIDNTIFAIRQFYQSYFETPKYNHYFGDKTHKKSQLFITRIIRNNPPRIVLSENPYNIIKDSPESPAIKDHPLLDKPARPYDCYDATRRSETEHFSPVEFRFKKFKKIY